MLPNVVASLLDDSVLPGAKSEEHPIYSETAVQLSQRSVVSHQ